MQRLALPVRSPYPLTQPWTWIAPARTAARVLATAQPESSWQWIPATAPKRPTTSPTTRSMWSGSIPPRVSQSPTVSAPASRAASRQRSA